MIAESHFKDYELSLHQKRRHDELLQKSSSRKRLKSTTGVLGIIKEDALAAITAKRQKEDEMAKKKEHNMYMKFWRTKKDDILIKELIVRKNEKIKIKKVKKYTKQKIEMSNKDKCAIVNPKIEWKVSNLT